MIIILDMLALARLDHNYIDGHNKLKKVSQPMENEKMKDHVTSQDQEAFEKIPSLLFEDDGIASV
jgi:hypothetical protein